MSSEIPKAEKQMASQLKLQSPDWLRHSVERAPQNVKKGTVHIPAGNSEKNRHSASSLTISEIHITAGKSVFKRIKRKNDIASTHTQAKDNHQQRLPLSQLQQRHKEHAGTHSTDKVKYSQRARETGETVFSQESEPQTQRDKGDNRERVHTQQHFDAIIIGAGTSGIAYYTTADWTQLIGKEFPHITTIGQQELWEQMDQEHLMGQGAHLLSLPESRGPEYSSEFTRAGDYADNLQSYKNEMDIIESQVSIIKRPQANDKAQIIHTKDIVYTADKTIIATGSGPARQQMITEEPENLEGSDSPYQSMIDGHTYLKKHARSAPPGSQIAIEGGSATASWSYEKALSSGHSPENIYWFTRRSFDGAFPPGRRNSKVQEISEKYRQTGKQVTEARITEQGKAYLSFNDSSQPLVVDQYIYALGADIKNPPGAWEITSNFRHDLQPIYDTNRYFSDDETQTIIGLISNDKSLLIVGSAVFNMLKANGDERAEKYTNANKTLPTSAVPPEGIPTIIATIEALNDYMPLDIAEQVNYNLANRTQLAFHITSKYPNLTPSDANRFVKIITTMRTDETRPHGIDQDTIRDLEEQMNRKNYELKLKKLSQED